MKKKYPLQSSRKELREAELLAKKKIKRMLTDREEKQLRALKERFDAKKNSLRRHLNKSGKLKRRRKILHNKIIKKHFRNTCSIDPKDPDLYILGGVAGSGKTEVLVRLIPERTITVDNDHFKSELAKRSKSPMKRFRLAHAPLLHEESDILVNRAIRKTIREKRDTTLDMTFATYKKGKKLVERYRRAGYDIHLLGTQKYPHESAINVVTRFRKKGRYVPPEVVTGKGNRINRNVMRARKLSDEHTIMDTTIKGKPELVSKS